MRNDVIEKLERENMNLKLAFRHGTGTASLASTSHSTCPNTARELPMSE
jgi:hypothetical protein